MEKYIFMKKIYKNIKKFNNGKSIYSLWTQHCLAQQIFPSHLPPLRVPTSIAEQPHFAVRRFACDTKWKKKKSSHWPQIKRMKKDLCYLYNRQRMNVNNNKKTEENLFKYFSYSLLKFKFFFFFLFVGFLVVYHITFYIHYVLYMVYGK